jgi:hypothetical protein
MPIEYRIGGLRALSLNGHAYSQYELGAVCFNQELGNEPIYVSVNLRKKIIAELWDNEIPHNHYLQKMIVENRVGDLTYGRTLTTRLNLLHNRARHGDTSAFLSLFSAYKNNGFKTDTLETFGLSQTERFEKLKSLKAYNPTMFNTCMTSIYKNNCAGEGDDLLEPKFSDRERMDFLEDMAFNQNILPAKSILARAYGENQLLSEYGDKFTIKLEMSGELKLGNLYKLADLDCGIAQRILLQHFYGKGSGQKVYEIDSKLTITEKKAFDDAFRWALLGNKTAQECIVSSSDHLQRNALTFLFAVHETMRHVDGNS